MAARVFVNYRRADSELNADNIALWLQRHLGERNVFVDKGGLRAGQDFEKVLRERVDVCNVMLAVIGPTWLQVRDESGQRRLDDPDDWVRVEIERAIAKGITVIPVLVAGAKMPGKADLPGNLGQLLRQHAATIGTSNFRSDMASLLSDIREATGDTHTSALPLRIAVGAVAVAAVVAAAAIGYYALRMPEEVARSDARRAPSSQPTLEASPEDTRLTAPRPLAAIAPPVGVCALTARQTNTDGAGRVTVALRSSCGSIKEISAGYNGWTFRRRAPSNTGQVDMVFDLFAGPGTLTLAADGGASAEIRADMPRAGDIVKIALIWSAPVDLNLHVLQFGSRIGEKDDVWAGAPRTLMEAQSGQTGFISFPDDGSLDGDHVEVYTFLKTLSHKHGGSQIRVDYRTRGDFPVDPYCSGGALGRIDFTLLRFENGKLEANPLRSFIKEKDCKIRLPPDERYALYATVKF